MGASTPRSHAVALDAGALIALPTARGRALLRAISERDHPVVISAGALAQVIRDPARQALLSRLVVRANTIVAPLDRAAAIACGILLARTGTADVVDAHVVLSAHEHRAQVIVSSDPLDLRRLDARIEIERI